MFKIRNLDNPNTMSVDEKGPFKIQEYLKDPAIMFDEAVAEYYFIKLGGRFRQLICDLSKSGILIHPGTTKWVAGSMKSDIPAQDLADFNSSGFADLVSSDSILAPEITGSGFLMSKPTNRHLIILNLDDWNNEIVLEDGYFRACENSLRQKVIRHAIKSSAFDGDEGLFNLCLKGKGYCVIEVNCPKDDLLYIDLQDDVLRIEGQLAIAWSSSLNLTIEDQLEASNQDNPMGASGLVNVFSGTGTVLMKPVH